MQKKLIIFDYDGVIVDSLHINLGIARQACEEINHPVIPIRADIEELENISFEDLGRRIRLPKDKVENFADHVFMILTRNTVPPRVFTGISEVIQEVGKESCLAIVTTNMKRAVVQVLEGSNFLDRIDIIMGAEEPGSKSEKIRRAMDAFDVTPNNTYMIGDATSDIREAQEAGVKSIAVTWGYHSKEKLMREAPDFIVNSPNDIISILSVGKDR